MQSGAPGPGKQQGIALYFTLAHMVLSAIIMVACARRNILPVPSRPCRSMSSLICTPFICLLALPLYSLTVVLTNSCRGRFPSLLAVSPPWSHWTLARISLQVSLLQSRRELVDIVVGVLISRARDNDLRQAFLPLSSPPLPLSGLSTGGSIVGTYFE